MRCKKHLTDPSSSVGVCATCLRERLFVLIAAQVQAQAQTRAQHQDHRKSDTTALVFPRSVSPYISHRKSDTSTWQQFQHNSGSDQRFFNTPYVGPTGSVGYDKKKNYYFRTLSLFSGLFRSDPRVSNSDATSSSPSWISSILTGRRKNKKKSKKKNSDESSTIAGDHRRPRRNLDRGMSPARFSDSDDEQCTSGYSSEQTPRRTPAAACRRSKASHNRNLTGMAFCLSPLVRASPARSWSSNQKMPPEMMYSGELRLPAPAKPHLATATSFCKNRSRKLADFGRFNSHR